MVHHVVSFTFTPDASPESIDTLQSRLEALPGLIPEVRAYRVVRDARLREGNADMAVLADFDDAEGFLTYANHPDHLAVIAECIRPIVASRSALQYAD
jgi:hypothetical protein